MKSVVKFLWGLALGTVLLLGAVFFAPFDTNFNSLIGKDTDIPIAEVLDKNANSVHVLFAGQNFYDVKNIADEFYHNLNKSDFKSIQFKMTKSELDDIVQSLLPYKNDFLTATDKQLLLDKKYHTVSQNRIADLMSVAPNIVPIKDDPYGLLNNYIMGLANTGTNWSTKDGFIWTLYNDVNYVLMNLELNDVQKVADLQRIANKTATNGVRILLAGAPVHTYETSRKSALEINIFGALATLSVLVLSWLLLRRMRFILWIVSNLLVSFLFGVCATILLFNNVHILTLVFGTSLIGLAIDYSFHFFADDDRRKMYRNMFLAYITTALCFTPFLFSDVSLLNQIGCFTIAGLTSVLINVCVFYPNPGVGIRARDNQIRLPYKRYIVAGVVCFVALTLPFMHIKTNMGDLYKPSDKTAYAEKTFAEVSGMSSGQYLMIRGESLNVALATGEEIGVDGGIFSILPSGAVQAENRNLIAELYNHESGFIRNKLNFSPIYVDTPDIDIGAMQKLIAPFVIDTGDYVYLLTPISAGADYANSDNVFVVNPAEFMSGRINYYAVQTYKSLLIVACVLFVFLGAVYRRRVVQYILPPALSILTVLGLLVISGHDIHLFHLLALFIMLGVGIDYAIFNISGGAGRTVLFSFLTSLIGFGLLAFASFPLISSMGAVLGIGLVLSYIFALQGGKNGKLV